MTDSKQLEKVTEPTRGSSLLGPAEAFLKKYLGPKQDTSWHDSMVKQANDSKKADAEKAAPRKKMPRKR